MILAAEEQIGLTHVISGIAAIALTWAGRNAVKIRRIVFGLWAKFEKGADALDVLARRIDKIDDSLKALAVAFAANPDAVRSINALRQAINPIVAATQSLANETREGSGSGKG